MNNILLVNFNELNMNFLYINRNFKCHHLLKKCFNIILNIKIFLFLHILFVHKIIKNIYIYIYI